jgi:lysophospholipase L1-like esterase
MQKKLLGFLLFAALAGACAIYYLRVMGKAGFWASDIAAFEKADRLNPPKPGVIVFVGSSSIRFWKSLSNDMQPLDVINRGFGGSQIDQVNEYAPRIVLAYRPRAVVLYAGDNDLSWPSSKSPERVSSDFQHFVDVVHTELPETWIYFISIKPSLLRWKNWEKFRKTNELIAAYIQTQPRVQFIDVASAMLDAQGKPRRELFRSDGLHLNAKGYELWTAIVKPILLSRFGAVPSS